MCPIVSEGERRRGAHVSAATVSTARDRLWAEHCDGVRRDRAPVLASRSVAHDGYTMPFWYTCYGAPPRGRGRSLYIAMHGGGGCPTPVNDSQYADMKQLYRPQEGVYLVPRAPTDTWNLWHQPHIDELFDRLIADLVVLENVDPDRVYLMGYSAGGDGVYQLAPRMADRLAAAAMMAGHPNDADARGLRNLPFTLHVGANDRAYNRNTVAAEWGARLDHLQADDPAGYVHETNIHRGLGHWVQGRCRATLPWMAARTRVARPERVVWVQSSVTHQRFYWLAVDNPTPHAVLIVERSGQTVRVIEAKDVPRFTIRLDDDMFDLDREVVVLHDGRVLFKGTVPRSVEVLTKTLAERGDPRGMFCAEVTVQL